MFYLFFSICLTGLDDSFWSMCKWAPTDSTDPYGGFHGVPPIAGWFRMGNPKQKWMMTGDSPILGNHHFYPFLDPEQEQTIYAFEFEDDEAQLRRHWMLDHSCHRQARDTFALCLGMFVDQRRSEAEVPDDHRGSGKSKWRLKDGKKYL